MHWGGLNKSRGVKMDRSFATVRKRCPEGTMAEHLAQPESMNLGRLSGGGDIWTEAWRTPGVCQKNKGDRQAKRLVWVHKGGPQTQNFSFGQSLSPWDGGFLVLPPPSSVQAIAPSFFRHTQLFTWGFPEAFSQRLGQWRAFCELPSVWLLANHFPLLGWSYP